MGAEQLHRRQRERAQVTSNTRTSNNKGIRGKESRQNESNNGLWAVADKADAAAGP